MTLTGKITRETEKAVLFKAVGMVKGQCWFPKSQTETLQNSTFDYLVIPEWLAEKRLETGELYL